MHAVEIRSRGSLCVVSSIRLLLGAWTRRIVARRDDSACHLGRAADDREALPQLFLHHAQRQAGDNEFLRDAGPDGACAR
jgi:hypothetical protein